MSRRIGFKDQLSKLKIQQAAVNIRKYLEWKGKEVLVKGKKVPLGFKSKKKTLVASNNSNFVLIWGAIYVYSGKYSSTIYLRYILNFTGKASIFVNIFLAFPILFLQIY